jgi:AcrR family transcriptional regulator
VVSEDGGPIKPRGREQVRSAVLEATRELVALRGPDRFTVRDIAARAGVNHALVHRYFGTKDAVVDEVLADESRAVAAAVTASGVAASDGLEEVVDRLLALFAERPTYWRALVNSVLDHPDGAVAGTGSTTDLFATLWSGGDPESADATAVAGVVVLGWLLFGDFMAQSTDASPATVQRLVVEIVCGLIEGRPPAGGAGAHAPE